MAVVDVESRSWRDGIGDDDAEAPTRRRRGTEGGCGEEVGVKKQAASAILNVQEFAGAGVVASYTHALPPAR